MYDVQYFIEFQYVQTTEHLGMHFTLCRCFRNYTVYFCLICHMVLLRILPVNLCASYFRITLNLKNSGDSRGDQSLALVGACYFYPLLPFSFWMQSCR